MLFTNGRSHGCQMLRSIKKGRNGETAVGCTLSLPHLMVVSEQKCWRSCVWVRLQWKGCFLRVRLCCTIQNMPFMNSVHYTHCFPSPFWPSQPWELDPNPRNSKFPEKHPSIGPWSQSDVCGASWKHLVCFASISRDHQQNLHSPLHIEESSENTLLEEWRVCFFAIPSINTTLESGKQYLYTRGV